MNTSNHYDVGLYLRLSREDEHASESESIANQRNLLMQYVNERGWRIAAEYADDGYTGTNFQRPGFQKMLDDIEKKRINCVITKDMSRLGRDYIETGYYIERFFPEKHIRYIAISDGIDTSVNNSSSDITPFRAVINDFYAKDISNKIRGALKAKMNAGAHIGSFAPYGYRKDPNVKNHLIIDEETAPIVQRIFDMYLNQGLGYTKIAGILTEDGIDSPMVHKQRSSNYSNPNKSNIGRWTHDIIKQILQNPAYTGVLAQGKQQIISYKVKKKVNIPKDQWIMVEGTHEAVISKSEFDAVQALIARKISHEKKRTSLLGGIFYCGDCGTRMTYTNYYTAKRVEKIVYICAKHQRHGACSRHTTPAEQIEAQVIAEIRSVAKRILDYEKLRDIANTALPEKSTDKLEREIQRTEKKLYEMPNYIKRLYMDRANGIVSESDYITLRTAFEQEHIQLKEKIEKLKQDRDRESSRMNDQKRIPEIIETLLQFETMDKQLLIKLVKRIEVLEDKSIIIEYNFQAPV